MKTYLLACGTNRLLSSVSIEDMTARSFVEKTRNDYIRHVRTLRAFLSRAPDAATGEDLRRFQPAPRLNG
jgi:hypothetical protein